MKNLKNIRFYTYAAIFAVIFASACGNIHQTPEGAIVAFIVAAEQRDMTKAWNILSPDLQAHYNSLGEKMRKSGRGALENEIARIKTFRSVKKDYRLKADSIVTSTVRLITVGGNDHLVETIQIDGDYKIKDEKSLRNILDVITAEENKKEGY